MTPMLTGDHDMTFEEYKKITAKKKITDGIYFLHPEGSCWIGAHYRNGRYVGRIEESNAATHAAANDHYAGIVPSESDHVVEVAIAEAIIREVMGDNICVEMVIVTSRNAECTC